MEELRKKLVKLINEEGPLSKRVLKVSQELDKLIVEYYKEEKILA
jgi:hypothetical protein